MANFTPNINLRKPVPTENFDIDRDFNVNWDAIDEELGNLEAGVANTYTKAEVDTKDSLKADKADTYTKAEVDGKDALKADLSEIETARGTEPTLGARLDADKAEVSVQLAEKVQNFKLKNVIENGDFSQGTVGWNPAQSVLSVSNNELVITGDGMSNVPSAFSNDIKIDVKVNDKIYVRSKVTTTDNQYTRVRIRSTLHKSSITDIYGEWIPSVRPFVFSAVILSDVQKEFGRLYFDIRYADSEVANGKIIKVGNLLSVNLTKTFGAGNEPTKEEMDRLVEMIPNQWWDGELDLTQQQYVNFLMSFIREKASNLKATNIITNGDFSQGLAGWTSMNSESLVNGNTLTNTGNGTSNSPQVTATTYRISGNKYYQFAKIKPLSDLVTAITFIGFTQSVIVEATPNIEKLYSGISTSSSTGYTSFVIRHGYDSNSTSAIEISYAGVIDLTATFGAGNEPTKEQMDRLMAEFPNSWFDGTQEILPLKTVNKLLDEKANKEQEAWITPTLLNGLESGEYLNNYQILQYRKNQFGNIEFRGMCSLGSYMSGSVAFVLPFGFRPVRAVNSVAGTGGANRGCIMEVRINGEVVFFGTLSSYVAPASLFNR